MVQPPQSKAPPPLLKPEKCPFPFALEFMQKNHLRGKPILRHRVSSQTVLYTQQASLYVANTIWSIPLSKLNFFQ